MRDDLINAIIDLDEDRALLLVREEIINGATPLEIVERCRHGVELVGKRYSEEIYYLSDLIMSEEIFRGIMEILEPCFKDIEQNKGMKIVMGTIEGDIHDLGKNIIISLLRSVGFEVFDLGVDVQPEQFINKIIETGADIVGISVVLTFSINSVRKVIQMMEESGLRDKVTVVIGGYPVDKRVREYTGADYFETEASKAVELMKRLAEEKNISNR
ncbi:cobalamin-binding protein [Geosporobacter ferrireducens]|uniref:Cobalamin-binding protein n=1 Tax=Geosporobacter ferrireducens TaxID=1424294 RepID=A0A1D8GQK3_9FIRM|nr:cobalamin-dependent protein [Geosporobacter ferrireducens]AOT73221.1 cobalamin-binding protein [Geosporobacter ferrireducens]MTI57892.1 cobalamin-binding protein [Geosporobacter ferrireducens]